MSEQKDNDNLQFAFSEILDGKTQAVVLNKPCWIKHFNHFDLAKIERLKSIETKKLKDRGVPDQKDRLVFLNEQGFWTSEDESKHRDQGSLVSGLKKNRRQYQVTRRDRESYQTTLDAAKLELKRLDLIRTNLLGSHLESFVERKINEAWMFHSLYSDSELTQKLWSEEDYDYLSPRELDQSTVDFCGPTLLFSELNIKRIALAGFFQNIFFLANSCYEFYGKPVCSLTFYQSNLASYGGYYKRTLENMDSKHLDEETLRDPEKFEDWIGGTSRAAEMNKNMSGTEKEGAFVSMVNAEKEDYKKLGMEIEKDELGSLLKGRNEVQLADLVAEGFF